MARGMGFSSVVLFLILFAVALGVVVVLRHGISAKDEPTRAEILVARNLRHLAIPAGARKMPNPVPSTPDTVKAGMEHFADHCATCHGNDGSGDTEIGRSLYPKAPDMRTEETQALSDGELFYIIENGIRFTGMPGWRPDADKPAGGGSNGAEKHEEHGEHEGHDSWMLVSFIRHLPKLTDEEKERMRSLNPKGPEEWEQEQQMREFLKGGDTPASPSPVESGANDSGHHHGSGSKEGKP